MSHQPGAGSATLSHQAMQLTKLMALPKQSHAIFNTVLELLARSWDFAGSRRRSKARPEKKMRGMSCMIVQNETDVEACELVGEVAEVL